MGGEIAHLFRQKIDIGAVLDKDGADAGVAVMSGYMQRSEARARLDIDGMVLLQEKIRRPGGEEECGGGWGR